MSPISFFGSTLLILTFVVAFLTAAFYLIGYLRGDGPLTRSGKRGIILTATLLTLAVISLISGFLTDDFTIKYVYGYSNRTLPFFYKVTGLWAGLDGSLLFWTWLVSLYALIVFLRNGKKHADWMPYITAVMMGVVLFFVALMVFINNPFTPLGGLAEDGKGLNPLLQNVAMVIHPPTLYLGFTAFTVPFAYVVAALITRRLDSTWIEVSRRWTIIAWFFLTMGLILGGAWAYVELGWGGFWAWDPVENAALMPFLMATAYLHSVMIQKKRGMMMVWNVSLIAMTFIMTIVGTYLTRSGVVQSVHAFSESEIGIYFLFFIIFLLIFSAYLIISRLDNLRSQNTLQSLLSKESAFLVNNILLVVATFAVMWGTLFPSITELFIDQKITVGPPFFNQIMAPIGLALLFLMGFGPVISWKKASLKNLRENVFFPLLFGVGAAVVAMVLGLRQWYVVGTVLFVAFVLGTHFLEFYRGLLIVRREKKLSFPSASIDMIIASNRRYGGYIIHIGVLFIFAGIAGTVFQSEKDFALNPGESYEFGGYRLEYVEPMIERTPHKLVLGTLVALYKGDKKVDDLTPSKNMYHATEQPTTEVDIYLTALKDVYLIVGNLDEETGRADFRVTINPLISFVWLGGLVILVGVVIVLIPRGLRAKPTKPAMMASLLFFTLFLGPVLPAAHAALGTSSDATGELAEGDPFLSADASDPKIARLRGIAQKLLCACTGCVRMELGVCTCPFAKNQRREIMGMIESGLSDQEIIDGFVDRYGMQIFVKPPEQGFFLIGYWAPLAILVTSVVAGALLIRVWHRRGETSKAEGAVAANPTTIDMQDPYAQKLSEELKRI